MLNSNNLQVGDVLQAPSGRLRIIRQIHRNKHTWLTFTMQHCSWTGRAVTCYQVTELNYLGYRKTKARVKLNSRFDKLLSEDATLPCKPKTNFTCCDVVGIP